MSQSLQIILNDFIKEQGKSVVKKKRTFESYITDLLKDYPAERTISVYLSQIGTLSKLASPATKNFLVIFFYSNCYYRANRKFFNAQESISISNLFYFCNNLSDCCFNRNMESGKKIYR